MNTKVAKAICLKVFNLALVCGDSALEEYRKLASRIYDACEEICTNADFEEIKNVLEGLLDECAHADLVYEELTEIYQMLEA